MPCPDWLADLLPNVALQRSEVRPQKSNFDAVGLQNSRRFLVDQQQNQEAKNWHKAENSQDDAENGSVRFHGQKEGENCRDQSNDKNSQTNHWADLGR